MCRPCWLRTAISCAPPTFRMDRYTCSNQENWIAVFYPYHLPPFLNIQFLSLSLSLSIDRSIYVSLSMYLYLSIYLSIYLTTSQCMQECTLPLRPGQYGGVPYNFLIPEIPDWIGKQNKNKDKLSVSGACIFFANLQSWFRGQKLTVTEIRT